MNACKDCRFFSGVWTCRHPSLPIDHVLGRPSEFARTVRRNPLSCGPQGAWFQARRRVWPAVLVIGFTLWAAFCSR